MLRARYTNVNRDLTEKIQEHPRERSGVIGTRKKVENVDEVEKRGKIFLLNLTSSLSPD
jgi:hypothetical protein